MDFCKCGGLLVPKKGKSATALVCRKCGKSSAKKGKVTISETIHDQKKKVAVIGKGESQTDLPSTHILCPECEHGEAFWWMQQTRSADEPPTMFYKCKKCHHSWRSYG